MSTAVNDDQDPIVLSVVDDPSSIDDGKCTVTQVALNLVNATVGAGIIGLPFALREAGFGLGILLAFFIALLTNLSLILMYAPPKD